MAAGFFQLLRPLDIIFLVKTRFQLDEDQDLFPGLRRRRQSGNNRRLPADAIKRLLNRQDVWIARRLLNELDNRAEALERMIQDNVAVPEDGKNIALTKKRRRRLRNEARIFQVGPIADKLRKLRKESQIEGPWDPVDVDIRNFQIFIKLLNNRGRRVPIDFEPDDLAPLAFMQLIFDFHQQISRVFVVDFQIGVPGDPKTRDIADLDAAE